MERPDWDEYFMLMARVAALRSTCERRQIGAVIVKDNRILTTGYNGAPSGIKHCRERGGCMRNQLNIPSGTSQEKCMATHAEQNAIVQAAYLGVSVKDSTMYCTTQPCVICSKMIVNAGIRSIYIEDGYPDDLSLDILTEAGVSINLVKKE